MMFIAISTINGKKSRIALDMNTDTTNIVFFVKSDRPYFEKNNIMRKIFKVNFKLQKFISQIKPKV